MVEKKSVWTLLVGIYIILSLFASAQNAGLDNSEVEGDAAKILNATEKMREFTEEDKWEYLSKELLLKNKFISSIDRFFKNFNFLFVFFFAENYELSLTLVFVILLWIFFFAIFGKIIAGFSTFSKPVSYIGAFLLAIILAHLKFFDFISLILFKIIFFREGIWGGLSVFIFLIVYFIILIYLEQIIWKIGRSFKKNQEEKEKWDEKFKFKVFEKRMEGMEGAFKEVGGGFS